MSHIPFSRVSRAFVFMTLATFLLVIFPATASARVGVGIGFYGGYYGPYGWGPWGYPYYGYAPYGYYPYGYGYPGRPLGEVQIKSPDNDAQIFINGAFAGRAHDLKRFYLVPGTYNVEQRIGSDVQKQHVYVIANRTLKLEFGKPGTVPPAPAPPPPAPNAPNSSPNNAPGPAPNSEAYPQQAPAPPQPDASAAPAPEGQR